MVWSKLRYVAKPTKPFLCKQVVPMNLQCDVGLYYALQEGWSALMVASQNAHVEVVDKLLQHGARVDLQTEVCSVPNGYNDVWGLMH